MTPGTELRFGEGALEAGVEAHHLAGGFHLRAQDGVDVGEAGEREHRLLHRDVRRDRIVVQREVGGQFGPGHHPGADLGDRHAGRLGDERHGAGGARIHLQHVDRVVLDGVLHVHQPDDVQRLGHRLGFGLQFGDHRRRQGIGRQRAGGIAGMDAGFLDMLHDAGDVDAFRRRQMQSTSTSIASLR